MLRLKFSFSVFFIGLTVLACQTRADEDIYAFNAMAPLELTSEEQWSTFEQHLQTAKQMGLDGVSVDVWWGKVEAQGDQVFDWQYYHRIAELFKKHGLQWIPIMSFHQCGGNVGDTCNIPIPQWIWTHFDGVAPQQLQFKSEQGNYAAETLSFWQTEPLLDEIYRQYAEFISAFAQEFGSYSTIIQEINISMGPAGELRYPSYNSHDEGTGFPSRGGIQGLSTRALEAFADHVATQTDMTPSDDRALADHIATLKQQVLRLDFDTIFSTGAHFEEGLAQTYLHWYHTSLVEHGERMLEIGHSSLQGALKEIPIGFKIPGIHWQISAPGGMRRSAELAAGLVSPLSLLEPNNPGYESILSIAQSFQQRYSRTINVHFTALEMSNAPTAPSFSQAKTLVTWLSETAKEMELAIKGENALAAGVYSKAGWLNIEDALNNGHYSGLTVLRIGDIASETNNALGHKQYKRLITNFNK